MNYNINYVFRLVDNFTGGTSAMVAAMARVERASRAMGAGLAVGAAGLMMGGMFASAVEAAGKWEDKMANVRRTADLSRTEMLSYGRDALDLSVKLGTPVEKVADTMSRLAQQGLRGQEMLKGFTELTTKAAVAWDDISPEEAGKSIGKFSQIWYGDLGPEGTMKGIKGLGDAINELSNRSNFKAPQLLKYLDRASPIMKQLGFTAEQAVAFGGTALTTGVESGQLQGTRAEMTIRQLLNAAAKPTKNQTWALGKLGLDPKTLAASITSSPQDTLLGLMERVQQYDPIGRTAVANNLLGTRQGAQFIALANNLNEYKRQLAIVDDTYAKRFSQDPAFMGWLKNTGKYDDMVEMMERVGKITSRQNSLDREFEKRSDTLKFAIAQRTAAWEKLKTALGIPLLEPMAALNKGLAGALDGVGNMIMDNPSIGPAVGYGLGASLAASIAAGLYAGMTARAGTGLLARIFGGLLVGGLTLTIGVALVGAGAWIFLNWENFVAKLTQPLNLAINWPEAPAWLNWLWQNWSTLMSRRDGVLNEDAQRNRVANAFDGSYGQTFGLSAGTDSAMRAADKAASDYARNMVSNPFMQFPPGYDPVAPNWHQSLRGFEKGDPSLDWNGRDSVNGATIAASIPQAVSVTVDPVNFNPATIQVQVSGQVNGPLQGTGSGTLQAEPSRGTSTSTVGGSGGGLSAPNPSNM